MISPNKADQDCNDNYSQTAKITASRTDKIAISNGNPQPEQTFDRFHSCDAQPTQASNHQWNENERREKRESGDQFMGHFRCCMKRH